jgi:hypothetical protein
MLSDPYGILPSISDPPGLISRSSVGAEEKIQSRYTIETIQKCFNSCR